MRFIRLSFTCLLLCVSLTSFAWKIVKEKGDREGKIKTVLIVDDRLILVTGDGVVDVKLSELEKFVADRKRPSKKERSVATKSMELPELFKKHFEWYVFSGRSRGFKALGTGTMRVFRDGDFVKGVIYRDRLYLQGIDGQTYAPTWEINYDFGRFFIPADAFLKELKRDMEKKRIVVVELDNAIAENQRMIFFYIDQIVRLLGDRNFTRAKLVDKKGNVNLTYIKEENLEPNAMMMYRELKYKVHREMRMKRRYEKQLRSMKSLSQGTAEAYESFLARYNQLTRRNRSK